MKVAEKRAVNRAIDKIVSPIYFNEIPLSPIFEAIESFGYLVVDEEHQPWSGFLCGREGTAMFDLFSKEKGKPDNSNLMLQWYTIQSGRYEVTCYVS